MFTAALLDLGADQDVLRKALDSLRLPGYRVEISRVTKSGLAACDFSVHLDAEHENHDHDMEYLHGADAGNHVHGAEHSYVHHHSHQHTHEHRGLADIMAVIKQADLSDYARNTAVRIFKILAEAEAKAHGVSIDQVHFHEVGAVDSIVDIVAAAVCLDNLDIKEVIVPILNEGTGFVRCQHGMIPVPVPAVAAIAEKYALTLRIHNMEGEFVTPTGAAIAAAVRTKDRLPEKFTILKTGLGAGKRT